MDSECCISNSSVPKNIHHIIIGVELVVRDVAIDSGKRNPARFKLL